MKFITKVFVKTHLVELICLIGSGLILVACLSSENAIEANPQTLNTPTSTSTEVEIASPLTPKPSVTIEPIFTPTPVFTPAPSSPSATSSPTPQPTASPSQLLTTDLIERGTLWTWQKDKKQYLVVDLDQGQVTTITPPEDCLPGLLPGTTQAVCQTATGDEGLYLLDLVTNQREDLPLGGTVWYRWSPSGRFLLYALSNEAERQDFYSYEFATEITQTLAIDVEPFDWLTELMLSSNGEYLAGIPSTRVAGVSKIIQGTADYQQIGPDTPSPTWDMSWSTTASQLVYGATDIEQKIAPRPNYLFFLDMETEQSRLLAETDGFFEIGRLGFEAPLSSPWSPDGEQLVVVDEPFEESAKLCIITLDTGNEACQLISSEWVAHEEYFIRTLAWSPQGNQIAFWTGVRGTREDRVLGVFIPAEQRFILLLDKVNIALSSSQMFWR